MTPLVFIAAILACGAGALVRYLLTTLGHRGGLPWPTFAANVIGSLALGVIAHMAVTSPHPTELLLIAGAGFAGGLTTFSTLAVDAVVLWREGRRAWTAAYLAASVVGGVACAALGWLLASAL